MGKNTYIQKKQSEELRILNIGMQCGEQFALDCFQIALHRMGWGYDRMKRLMDLTTEVANHYFSVFETGVEQDYIQECMDRELHDLVKDKQEFHPFNDRYPYVKQVSYGRRAK